MSDRLHTPSSQPKVTRDAWLKPLARQGKGADPGNMSTAPFKLGLAATGALLAASVIALPIVANRTKVVTVDDAVARFRKAAQTAPTNERSSTDGTLLVANASPTVEAAVPAIADAPVAPGASSRNATAAAPQLKATAPQPAATTATSVPRVVTAGATHAATPPGVYSYNTTGTESVGVPGASPHTYPATTTMTVRKTACGTDQRWDALQERWDSFSFCRDANGLGLLLTKETLHHEFLHQVDEKHFVCTGGASYRPASDAVGTQTSGRCADGDAVAVMTTKNVAIETIQVGNDAVAAMHVRIDESLEGSFNGHRTVESWYAMSDDVLVRRTTQTDTETDSTIGRTRYQEQATLQLASLTPRT